MFRHQIILFSIFLFWGKLDFLQIKFYNIDYWKKQINRPSSNGSSIVQSSGRIDNTIEKHEKIQLNVLTYFNLICQVFNQWRNKSKVSHIGKILQTSIYQHVIQIQVPINVGKTNKIQQNIGVRSSFQLVTAQRLQRYT